jgi:hypothetical protein
MLHSVTPTFEILNANVPLNVNKIINFNTTGIADGVKQFRISASADKPVYVEVQAQVVTAFNAAGTNVLTVGTDTTANQWLGSGDITEGTPGFYPASNAVFKTRLLADTDVYAKYTGGAGTQQVETAVVVEDTPGTLTAGNATVTVTAAGMPNSPKAVVVALATNDTEAQVATKFRAALTADTDVGGFFTIGGTGPNVVATARTAAANDGTMNIAYADTTSSGLADDATSNNTTAGVAPATTGQAVLYFNIIPLFQGT